jgi:ferric-dicitrate binding protein FerR (iron transport regulator)
MRKQKHLSRAAKYFIGETTLIEVILFRISLLFSREARNNYKWLNEMKAFKTDKRKNDIKFDTDAAWNKFQQKIAKAEDEVDRQIGWTPYKLAGVAASLLVIVVASFLTWSYLNPETVKLINYAQDNTLIRTLPDGTQVFLSHNALLEYPKRFVGRSRVARLKGEAYFDVSKNPNRPFIIQTEKANIEVVGTAFNVKTTKNNVQVNVTEGKVRVTLANITKSALVSAGESAIANGTEIIKLKPDKSHNVNKRMKILMFQDEYLEDIIRVINKTYGTKIYLIGDDLKAMKISVTFDNEPSNIVNVLSASFNLKVTANPDGSIMLSN